EQRRQLDVLRLTLVQDWGQAAVAVVESKHQEAAVELIPPHSAEGLRRPFPVDEADQVFLDVEDKRPVIGKIEAGILSKVGSVLNLVIDLALSSNLGELGPPCADLLLPVEGLDRSHHQAAEHDPPQLF